MIRELEFLIRIVKNAASMITDEFEVKAKGERGDLITNFDTEIEEYLISEIKKEYSGFSIVSEEFNTTAVLSKNCFTIDPIDGTINFANEIPLWGIQVACIKEGKTIAAVIYLPKLNEMYYADKNGTFLNDKKINVNKLPIDKSIYVIEGKNRLPSMVRMKRSSIHHRDLWCAAVNFAWTAAGRLGGTIFRNDTPWDYIPGLYLVKQAGGFISDEKGAHIAANSKEFVKLLKQEAGLFEGDKAITNRDN